MPPMPPKRKRQSLRESASFSVNSGPTGTPPRRKACLQCFEAKSSYEHKCAARRSSEYTLYTAERSKTSFNAPAAASNRDAAAAQATNIDLLCTVDASRVRDRWLEGWVPRPGQQPKELRRGTAVFIHGVLKTYPQVLCRGDFPPIVHGLQRVGRKLPRTLENCASIARMWEGQVGAGVICIVQRQKYDPFALLAAFQAYIMYVTLLLDPSAEPVVPQSIMLDLQDFAHTIALTGLEHPWERPAAPQRPPWRAWALAEAKRRSLFAMYMLDDVVNTFSSQSCILGDELADLLAPCSAKLWGADDESAWRRLYDVHVGEWEGGGLRLGELWPSTGTKDEERVGAWVRDMDALGMVIFSVTTATQYK
ncbi:hypothetical protein N0V90_007427 [Kalmusia sp. IMI 367209]|nr:hypothetical protein N0V90_007427 [Kalmusia sp. IMI 367209]